MINQKSIAVLPLENLSSDRENEYFSDGVTEEIINALCKVEGLKVTARTSSFVYKNRKTDVRQIGNELGVALVLEGSIRKAGNHVRITTQLIQTDKGFHLWSENFDRKLDDIFALQDEISLLVADRIRENYGHLEIQEHLVEAPTQNQEAYNLYLKARYHQLKWNADDLSQAIIYYRKCIDRDPNFALSYFGAGLSYGIMATWGFLPYEEAIEKVGEYFSRGFALNTESYLSHFALATTAFWGKWNFKEAQIHLLKSLRLNPSFTDAASFLAELHTAVGDFDQAMEHALHTLEISPFSPNNYQVKGTIEYLTGKYEMAIASMNAALQIDPNFATALEIITLCHIQLKDYHGLDDFLNRTKVECPSACRALYQLKYPEEVIDFDLNELDEAQLQKPTLIPWYLYLQVFKGNETNALNILAAFISKKSGQIINFRNDPFLIPLRQTETYQQLVAEVFQTKYLPDNYKEAPLQSVRSLMSVEEAETLLEELEISMEEGQLHQDASLSLRTLAEELDTHPNKLSWLLNEKIGKNFNEYINEFRLETFKSKALNPNNQHLTILGLAYESGFSSKSVFNDFFKKQTGQTPKAWVKAAKTV